MQQLARRTAMAERQVARRAARDKDVARRDKLRYERQRQKVVMDEIGASLNQAVRARHEDWELGPALAPNRDHALRRYGAPGHGQSQHYGAVSANRYNPELPLSAEAREARTAWAGGPGCLCLAKGDRAVVVEGPYKGRIGVISHLDRENCTVQIEGVAKTNVNLLDSQVGLKGLSETPVITVADYLPISAVRLVHPVTDHSTGATRDVVIRQLVPIRQHLDRPTRTLAFQRLVPGLNVTIPWPRTPPAAHRDHPADTLRIDAEERTYVPALLRPPAPEAVLDELRNRFSVFRTRHAPEYVAKKVAEQAEKERLRRLRRGGGGGGGTDPSMMTPLQELNRKRREERRALGQPVLSAEVLERIGRVIARNKGLAVESGEAGEEEGEQPTQRSAAVSDTRPVESEADEAELSETTQDRTPPPA